MIPECRDRPAIGGHCKVGEMPSHHLPQPFALLGNGVMPAMSQRLLHFLELGAHAVRTSLPLKLEVPLTGFAADERKSKVGKGFRFSEPALLA